MGRAGFEIGDRLERGADGVVSEFVSGDLCHCGLCAFDVLLWVADLGQYALTDEEAGLYIYAQGTAELDLGNWSGERGMHSMELPVSLDPARLQEW